MWGGGAWFELFNHVLKVLTYNSISNFHPLFTFPVIGSAPVTLTIDGIVKHVCSFHI